VTLDSGVKVVLERPAILGDSLVGYDPERHSIPLAHVKLVEVRRADDDATVALVLGLFAVGFIAVIVAATNAPSVHF